MGQHLRGLEPPTACTVFSREGRHSRAKRRSGLFIITPVGLELEGCGDRLKPCARVIWGMENMESGDHRK